MALQLRVLLRDLKCIDNDKRETKNRRILIAMNSVFYSFIVGKVLIFWFEGHRLHIWIWIDFISKVAPEIVLFVTIFLLRRFVRRLGNGILMGRDKLMTAHAVIFLVYIVVNCGFKID